MEKPLPNTRYNDIWRDVKLKKFDIEFEEFGPIQKEIVIKYSICGLTLSHGKYISANPRT
jgi:hypothetical protein